MTSEATCQHHWILEANKVDAIGVCKKCKARKLHRGTEYLEWAFGGPTSYNNGHRRESSMRGAAKGGKATGDLWKDGELL